jgi:enoyl-CoA hydratase/carnithine racemase
MTAPQADPTLLTEMRGPVAVLTLNRPGAVVHHRR